MSKTVVAASVAALSLSVPAMTRSNPPACLASDAKVDRAAQYANAIASCADVGDHRRACLLLRRLEKMGHPVGGRALTAALRACANAADYEAVDALLERARTLGQTFAPRAGYTAVIRAADAAGRFETAVRYYAHAVQQKHFRHWRDDEPLTLDLHGFRAPVAVAAVRYVLQHELGNFLCGDLRIITGRGRHSERGEPSILPRIERLLSQELPRPLRHDFLNDWRCDDVGCEQSENRGVIDVSVDDLLRWLIETRDFSSFVVRLPAEGGNVPHDVRVGPNGELQSVPMLGNVRRTGTQPHEPWEEA